MINENFVFLGLALSILGGLRYLIATLKGESKPNRVTWFFWALAPMIAFVAQIKQGVGIQSLLTFIVGFNPLLIFIASFVNKKAYWELRKADYVCAVLAILGIVLWQITSEPNIAIFFAIAADFVAAFPTIFKIMKFPETENIWIYVAATMNGTLTLLTFNSWTFENYAFPLYIVISSAMIFALIEWRKFVKTK